MLIDARGQKCPLPVLRAEKAVATLKPGETIDLLATDPMAQVDVPHFCAKSGLDVQTVREADATRFTITRPKS